MDRRLLDQVEEQLLNQVDRRLLNQVDCYRYRSVYQVDRRLLKQVNRRLLNQADRRFLNQVDCKQTDLCTRCIFTQADPEKGGELQTQVSVQGGQLDRQILNQKDSYRHRSVYQVDS